MSRPRVVTAHGTWTRASKQRCTCEDCVAVRKAHATSVDLSTGRLLVECWCRSDEVLVDPADVRSQITGVCGRARCKAPRKAAA